MARKTDMVNSNGQMDPHTLVNFLIIIFMVAAFMSGLIIDAMTVNG
jgi:hypothetical protein